MAFETALVAYLKSKTAITNVIGDRIFPQVAPQGTAEPYLVFARISGASGHHMTAADGVQQTRYQFDAYGRYSQVKEVGEALRQSLDGYRGAIGGEHVQTCHLMDERDLYEEPDDKQQFGTHRVSMDFLIAYVEDVPTFS